MACEFVELSTYLGDIGVRLRHCDAKSAQVQIFKLTAEKHLGELLSAGYHDARLTGGVSGDLDIALRDAVTKLPAEYADMADGIIAQVRQAAGIKRPSLEEILFGKPVVIVSI